MPIRDRYLTNLGRVRFYTLAILLLVYGSALFAPGSAKPLLRMVWPEALLGCSAALALAWWLWPRYKGWVFWLGAGNVLLVLGATLTYEWLAAILGSAAFRTAQCFTGGEISRDRRLLAALFLILAALVLIAIREGLPAGLITTVVTMVGALAGAMVGHLSWAAAKDQEDLAGFRMSSAKLAEANVRLQDFSTALEDLTIAQERNRVAREIHDTLGHTLTSILVKLEALDAMILRCPERAIAEVDSIIHAVLEGLSEVRASIKALRAPHRDGPTGREQWVRLMQAFAETTGVTVEPIIRESFDDLPEELNHAVYRVIQEGLTNAYRHGHAGKVSVDVWHERGLLMAVISDNGCGLPQLVELDDRPGAGYGLRGIKERVGALGGKVAWRSQPGRGFDLGLEIPYQKGSGQPDADPRADRR